MVPVAPCIAASSTLLPPSAVPAERRFPAHAPRRPVAIPI